MTRTELNLDDLLRVRASETHTYLTTHPEICSSEGARLLCRLAVATANRDPDLAEPLCKMLTSMCRVNPDPLISGYRDHAWGALYCRKGTGYRKVLVLWKRAISSFLAAGREDEAAITSSCGLQILCYLGETDLFREWEERARDYFERVGDRMRLARLRSNVATLYTWKDDWSQAKEHFEEAYRDFLIAGATPQDEVVTLMNISACHVHLGDLAKASRLVLKARALAEQAEMAIEAARCDGHMASIRYQQGDFTTALFFARRVKAYASAHELEYEFSHGAQLEADILLALCMPREAIPCAWQAHDGYASLGLKREQAFTLVTIGLCARSQGRYRASLSLLEQAKALFVECGNTTGAELAELNRAATLFEAGSHREAANLAGRLLTSRSIQSSAPAHVECKLLLARILLAVGEISEARRYAEDGLTTVSFLDRAPLEAQALLVLGAIHEREEAFELATETYSRAEHCLERMRSHLEPGALTRAFLSDKTGLYEAQFSLSLRLGVDAPALWAIAEKAKSRTLWELMTRHSTVLDSPDHLASPNLVELWKGISASLRQVEVLEAERAETEDGERQISALRFSLAEAERATLQLLGKDTSASRLGGVRPPTAQQLSERLAADTSLVEFYVVEGDVFAFLLTRAGCDLLHLGRLQPIEKACRLLRLRLGRRLDSTERPEARDLITAQHLRELYNLLWDPIARRLGTSRVVIVPHGCLHQLPFHALSDGEGFLIDRHAISYSPSGSVYYASRTPRRATCASGSLIIGSPDTRAPMMIKEAGEVARLLPQAELLVGRDATKKRLLERLPQARFIHIAGHGSFSPFEPSASAIQIGEGYLTVADLQDLRLAAELVVLSGCETGRTSTMGADEILGLAQALLQAGARAAMVTLWRVKDHTTAEFMRLFYSSLQQCLALDAALGQAMKEMRQRDEDPHSWAPFILVGDACPSEASAFRQSEVAAAKSRPGVL